MEELLLKYSGERLDPKAAHVNLIGAFAGILSLTEVGLGSVLHASRIPLRGQFLSLNQIFLLMRASCVGGESGSRLSPAAISTIAAILKSLSPIGNKLTPMLAISMQGWLFTGGIVLFGHSILGRITGGLLASLWAFIQPILLYGLIFGACGKKALDYGLQGLGRWTPITEEIFFGFLLGIVLIKFLLVIAMGIVASKISDSWFVAYTRKMSNFMSHPRSEDGALKGALRQMFRPFFLVSILLTGILLFMAEGSYESLVWHLLQPLGVGFLLFFGMRLLPLERIAYKLEKSRGGTLGQALRIALSRVRNL